MDYKEKSMIIDKYIIGDNQKRFVIAEIGMNHNGVYDNAIKLIDIAIEAGADCVILGCTEVCMLLDKPSSPLPIFDTTQIHCKTAIIEGLKG